MKAMKDNDEWSEGDAVWNLLGKAAPKEAASRFADDTVRAVKSLPEKGAWWTGLVSFLPWAAVAACGVFAAFSFLDQKSSDAVNTQEIVSAPAAASEAQWVQIEEVADAEMLSAAADHLDRFSDQELVSLIGF